MMSTYKNLCPALLVISLAFPALADDRLYKEYKSPIFPDRLFELRLNKLLPPDAADYVNRFRACQHWAGEDAYNAERAEQIRKGVEKNCVGLDDKEKSIRAKRNALAAGWQ